MIELDRVYSGLEIGHFRSFAKLFLKGPINGVVGLLFGTADNGDRLKATTVEQLQKGRSGIKEGLCCAQWEIRVREDQPSQEGEPENREKQGFEEIRRSTSTSVGQDVVPSIRFGYTHDTFIRLKAGPRLQDIDDCMFVFLLNRGLAEKIANIQVYANEYKLTEINVADIRLEDSSFGSRSPLLFSPEELADPWVMLRPKQASNFDIRFSEQTPRRFFHPHEVAPVTSGRRV